MRITTLLLAGLLLVGCSTRHGFGIKNPTNQDFKEVTLAYWANGDTYKMSVSQLDSHGSFYMHPAYMSIPRTGEATWRTPDGNLHKQELPINSVIPAFQDKPGVVTVEFLGNEVRAVFEPYPSAQSSSGTGDKPQR